MLSEVNNGDWLRGEAVRYKIYIGVTTNKGTVRSKNEDNFFVNGHCMNMVEDDISLNSECIIPGLFAISDGMGGLSNGKEASHLAIHVLSSNYCKLDALSSKEVQEGLNNLILKVNEEVYNMHEQGKASGCTLALIYFHKDKIFVANIGDSKVYQYKDRKLTQLSKDHNRTQERLNSEWQLSKKSSGNNVLTQYLGMSPKEIVIEPYHMTVDYDNKTFLLCSDGLTEVLSEKEIVKKLRFLRRDNLKKTTDNLVALAMRNGSKDNVTALLIKIQKVNEVRLR